MVRALRVIGGYGLGAALLCASVSMHSLTATAQAVHGQTEHDQTERDQTERDQAERDQTADTQKKRGWIGIYYNESEHPDTSRYVVIVSVEPGSPAHIAGMMAGDTVLSYNGKSAKGGLAGLQRYLIPKRAIRFKVRRNGVRDIVVTVAEHRSADSPIRVNITAEGTYEISIPLSGPGGQVPILMGRVSKTTSPVSVQARLIIAGAELADLNPDLAKSLRVKLEGVLVLSVSDNSPAQVSGIKGGDIIVTVSGARVNNVAKVVELVTTDRREKVNVELLRDGKKQTRTLAFSQ